jgi:hypothetical protein
MISRKDDLEGHTPFCMSGFNRIGDNKNILESFHDLFLIAQQLNSWRLLCNLGNVVI